MNMYRLFYGLVICVNLDLVEKLESSTIVDRRVPNYRFDPMGN